ncbi:MAG: 1-(5-phosphoribosyl)-5-[(5-phosphoribosylamino)methylideneamino] imidazole-4-carboxamide isomerase [Thermoplasmatales archaeon]|nr:MAG: 1-(5-phosphoribosyl)-5-[(5-phosphoribosylamino)methylideneamino] imidazole-4-carboxamide isomerase [Thermoplasmatales archaeon]
MFVIPSIDILNGKCVQLIEGNIKTAKIFGTPKEFLLKWIKKGANVIHVIDLNAAFKFGSNKKILLELLKNKVVDIQVGGGIRDENYAVELINRGAKRIIIGSKSLDRNFLETLAKKIPKKNLMVALDIRFGEIVSNAWQNDTGLFYQDGVKKISSYAGSILSTDVIREGKLQGPSLKILKKIVQKNIPTYASGGFTTIDDIKLAERLGFSGVVIGRALYKKKIDLEDLW